MIPFPVAPLAGVTVLVTRPEPQAHALCEQVSLYGGAAVSFPAIVIEPLVVEPPPRPFDWLVFVSTHAVQHGLRLVHRADHTRIAAIGHATAAALKAAELVVDALPEAGTTSEHLLLHPALAEVTGKSILIVKGREGRDLLHEQLTVRGAKLTTLDVYVRNRPLLDVARITDLERRWDDGGIDVVTITSVETLENLLAICGNTVRELLANTPFVTVSERIADAARAEGLRGDCILSRGADHASLIGAIAAWHARAR